MTDTWPLVGIARATPEPHGSSHVWVLDTGAVEPRDCGRCYTPAPIGANWFGYRVVIQAEWRRTLRAQRRAARLQPSSNSS